MSQPMLTDSARQAAIRATVQRSIWAIVAMVLFTLALIPLYRVFCDLTGLNGRSSGLSQAADRELIHSQSGHGVEYDIQFVTQIGAGLALDFKALESSQVIRPGGKQQVMFRFRNISDQAVVVKAVPSVSPAAASRHLLKIECFCFQELDFAPFEQKDIPLIYFLSAAVPDDIRRLTLAYNLYKVDGSEGG
ncbi:MAG: cytochrome c oxidase assembly protein [Saccharospirillaceae bacterium]|nr:cytochrome c oxidase assembly protein [Saccharospirillaceae bacterium]